MSAELAAALERLTAAEREGRGHSKALQVANVQCSAVQEELLQQASLTAKTLRQLQDAAARISSLEQQLQSATRQLEHVTKALERSEHQFGLLQRPSAARRRMKQQTSSETLVMSKAAAVGCAGEVNAAALDEEVKAAAVGLAEGGEEA